MTGPSDKERRRVWAEAFQHRYSHFDINGERLATEYANAALAARFPQEQTESDEREVDRLNAMRSKCIWEDCDQDAVYCPGHARELDLDVVLPLRAKLEQAEAERDGAGVVAAELLTALSVKDAEIERLQRSCRCDREVQHMIEVQRGDRLYDLVDKTDITDPQPPKGNDDEQ